MAGDPTRDTPPPFLVQRGDAPPSPLVVSVPHAGRFYPAEIEQLRAVGWPTLYDLEDRYADRLVARAVADGAIAIVATHARAWIDLNRAAEDRVAAPTSPHGRAGLGLIPQQLGHRPLWRRPPTEGEVDARVAALHRPYHAAIADALEEARLRHGYAILIDCHSMPPIGGSAPPRLVIGDRHGTSAGRGIVERLTDCAEFLGLAPARNRPYAGAHVLATHGRPTAGLHAIQLEFDRRLYLDQRLREPSAGLPTIVEAFATLCRAALTGTADAFAVAAE